MMPQTGDMRVQLKLVLDCPPDAAWNALQSPGVFREVLHPLAGVEPIDPPTFPEFWPDGRTELRITSFSGLVPLGRLTLDLARIERDDVRILEDRGHPDSGPLAVVTSWRHRMAVSPAADGRTLFRDRLDFSAGVAGAGIWPVLWQFWQYRGGRLKKLAPDFDKGFHR